MKLKPQILYIHGGSTYRSRQDFLVGLKNLQISMEKRIRWSDDFLDRQLGDKFDIIRPKMPLKECARYSEWKIYFEHHFLFLNDNIILIGFSLGGIFLAKYLSENKFPVKISSVILVAPPFDNSLSSEELVGGFKLKSNLSLISQNCPRVNLLFSTDDPLVTQAHAHKYRQKIPSAKLFFYNNKNGHFKVPKLPEIVKLIKTDFHQ